MSVEIKVEGLEGFEDVPIIEILVSEGDEVTEGQSLIVLESDKATMELPAPQAGTIASLSVKEGDTVSEGDTLGQLEPSDGSGAEPARPPSESGGDASTDADAQGDTSTDAEPADASTGEEAGGADAPGAAQAADHAQGGTGTGATDVYASPSVRRLARELGVDLAGVQGSGRKGRIVPEDVKQAKDRPAAAGDGASKKDGAPKQGGSGTGSGDTGLELLAWPTVDFAKQGEVERKPLSRIRRISAANLHRNWVRIPHVTHQDDADITDLEAFRKQLNGEQQDVKVTMVALLIKASAATLKAFPEVNSSLDGDDLVLKKYVNVGFAADTPNGLVVPVIKGVDGKGILEIAGELTELSKKARDGKLGPGAMSGATFTISSLGGIGGTGFTPIVNAPEVAILGATRSAMKPVWDGGQFVPRLILPLSLSYDHRVVDGAQAARFCAHLAGVLADMRRILL